MGSSSGKENLDDLRLEVEAQNRKLGTDIRLLERQLDDNRIHLKNALRRGDQRSAEARAKDIAMGESAIDTLTDIRQLQTGLLHKLQTAVATSRLSESVAGANRILGDMNKATSVQSTALSAKSLREEFKNLQLRQAKMHDVVGQATTDTEDFRERANAIVAQAQADYAPSMVGTTTQSMQQSSPAGLNHQFVGYPMGN